MKDDLENQLVKKYPALFQGKDKPPTESLMCFGCECGDGWFDIIDHACSLIANHMHYNPECAPFEFMQIKEKFGGLRLYFIGGDKYVEGVCSMAESMAYSICEVTGERGQLCSTGYWLRTLSPAEAAKHGYKPVKNSGDDELEDSDDELENKPKGET